MVGCMWSSLVHRRLIIKKLLLFFGTKQYTNVLKKKLARNTIKLYYVNFFSDWMSERATEKKKTKYFAIKPARKRDYTQRPQRETDKIDIYTDYLHESLVRWFVRMRSARGSWYLHFWCCKIEFVYVFHLLFFLFISFHPLRTWKIIIKRIRNQTVENWLMYWFGVHNIQLRTRLRHKEKYRREKETRNEVVQRTRKTYIVYWEATKKVKQNVLDFYHISVTVFFFFFSFLAVLSYRALFVLFVVFFLAFFFSHLHCTFSSWILISATFKQNISCLNMDIVVLCGCECATEKQHQPPPATPVNLVVMDLK